MQPGGVPDDQQIGHPPLDMVSEMASRAAVCANRVQDHRRAEKVCQVVGDRRQR